jgi:hypothetical protein
MERFGKSPRQPNGDSLLISLSDGQVGETSLAPHNLALFVVSTNVAV